MSAVPEWRVTACRTRRLGQTDGSPSPPFGHLSPMGRGIDGDYSAGVATGVRRVVPGRWAQAGRSKRKRPKPVRRTSQ